MKQQGNVRSLILRPCQQRETPLQVGNLIASERNRQTVFLKINAFEHKTEIAQNQSSVFDGNFRFCFSRLFR